MRLYEHAKGNIGGNTDWLLCCVELIGRIGSRGPKCWIIRPMCDTCRNYKPGAYSDAILCTWITSKNINMGYIY